MRLSDVMSQMQLANFAEVGLVLFLFAFAVICIKVFFFSSKQEMEQAARIPLSDYEPTKARRLEPEENDR